MEDDIQEVSKTVTLPRFGQEDGAVGDSIFTATRSNQITPSSIASREFTTGGIDSVGTDGQPIDIIQPQPGAAKALYEIEFVRKLYGANIDVLNTLEDIGFVSSYSKRNLPKLNIAYLTLWKRGNAPTAGEKVSEGTSFADANFAIDSSRNGLFKLENSNFADNASLYDSSFKVTPEGIKAYETFNKLFEGERIPEPTEWIVRAPDAVAGSNATQSPGATQNSNGTFPQFTVPGSPPLDPQTLIFTEGFGSILPEFGTVTRFPNPSGFIDSFGSKTETQLSRTELIAKAKEQLRSETSKPEPEQNLNVIVYLADVIETLETATDDQFNQGLELPPDPRNDGTQGIPGSGSSEPVRVGDVGWTNPNATVWDRSEKAEKIEGVWQFLFNPQSLERSYGPQYKFASAWGVPEGQAPHYTGHKNEELRFRDIILNGWVFGKKVESLMAGLEALTAVKSGSGQQSPPVLEFVWGKKVFGPCIMEDINVTEHKWDGGELVDATLSFTLKAIPEWIVNDEYINIFSPTGQPLVRTILEAPKSEGDAAPSTSGSASDSGNGSASTGSQAKAENSTNQNSNDCKTFRGYATELNKLRSDLVVLYNNVVRNKNGNARAQVTTLVSSYVALAAKVDPANGSVYSSNKFLKSISTELARYHQRIKDQDLRALNNKVGVWSTNRYTEDFTTSVVAILDRMKGLQLVLQRKNDSAGVKCGYAFAETTAAPAVGAAGPGNVTSARASQLSKCAKDIKPIYNQIKNIPYLVGTKELGGLRRSHTPEEMIRVLDPLNSALNRLKGLVRIQGSNSAERLVTNWQRTGVLAQNPLGISLSGAIVFTPEGGGNVRGCLRADANRYKKWFTGRDFFLQSNNALMDCRDRAIIIAESMIKGYGCP